jgi:hypothetical protein
LQDALSRGDLIGAHDEQSISQKVAVKSFKSLIKELSFMAQCIVKSKLFLFRWVVLAK